MKINSKIISILDTLGITEQDGLSYLTSLYHGYIASYTPIDLINTMDDSGIYSRSSNGINWDIELFNEDLGWLEEYIELFMIKNPQRGRHKKEVNLRMTKFLKENVNVTSNEILSATEFYLENTDPIYVKQPHYFISKGSGSNKTSFLTEWLEKDKERLSNSLLYEIK